MNECKTRFGDFIRASRMKLGLRQGQLSELVHLNQNSISMLETGKLKYLNDQQLEHFAKALKCEIEDLKKIMPERKVSPKIRKSVQNARHGTAKWCPDERPREGCEDKLELWTVWK